MTRSKYSVFDGIRDAGQAPDWWGGLDWSKASKAVVASSNGVGVVLSTAGPHVDFDISEAGVGPDLADLGLDDAPDGISVWEGKTAVYRSGMFGEETDTELQGTFRPPTDAEWEAIRRGECPWDPSEWEVEP